MDATKVRVKCISKKESQSYSKERPIQTEIELQVPYDQSSVFFQLSGGTAMKLITINQDAADMFRLGESYDVLVSPVVEEVKA